MKPHPLPRLAKALENLRSLEIVIDHLPYSELSPNSRIHWAVKARAVRASREEIGWTAKSQWIDQPPMIYARVSYKFEVKDKRHRDIDNLISSCKSFQDGLVDAGIISSDDSEHLKLGQCSVEQSDVSRTIIRIEEMVG